jgi:hypothetical protein
VLTASDALSAVVLTYRRCIFLGTRQSAFHPLVPEDHSSAISMAAPSSGPLWVESLQDSPTGRTDGPRVGARRRTLLTRRRIRGRGIESTRSGSGSGSGFGTRSRTRPCPGSVSYLPETADWRGGYSPSYCLGGRLPSFSAV